MNAIERLQQYRANKDRYLPLIDHETQYFGRTTIKMDNDEIEAENLLFYSIFIGFMVYWRVREK